MVPNAFAELRRKLPGVTQRMLTLQSRELQRGGVVQRVVCAVMPPKVEYSLTQFGHSLTPVLIASGLSAS
jgi:DNA-binding HxlR family transcriptional regulator